MSANQRKNKNKKKKALEDSVQNNINQQHNGYKSSSSGVIIEKNSPVHAQYIEANILLSGRKGSVVNSNKIYLSAGDMKTLNVQSGAYVLIHFDMLHNVASPASKRTAFHISRNGCMICQAWPSSELTKNTATLTRFWQKNFPDDSDRSHRSVGITKASHFITTQICTVATFILTSNSNSSTDHSQFNYNEITSSSSFRRYFMAALCDVVLCVGNFFTLSWRGELLTFQLVEAQVQGSDTVKAFHAPSQKHQSEEEEKEQQEQEEEEMEESEGEGSQTMTFKITPVTSFRFTLLSESELPPPASSVKSSSALSLSSGATLTQSGRDDLPVQLKTSLAHFGGYHSQLAEVWTHIHSGLQLDRDIKIAGDQGGESRSSDHPLPGSYFLSSLISTPKGLLIHGPRGTGKTLLMNQIANTVKTNFHIKVMKISHDILLYKFQGEAETSLQRIFEEASRNAPTLLLIDDLELICPQRSQLLSDLQRRIVSCMLTLIDGVTSGTPLEEPGACCRSVFILATSSQPNSIDTAMRRPGRLDREVELGVPTPGCRGEIITKLLGVMGLYTSEAECSGMEIKASVGALSSSEAISRSVIDCLAKKSHGMVGADLLLVFKEAHLIALDRISGLPHVLSSSRQTPNTDYSLFASIALEKLSLHDDGDVDRGEAMPRVDLNFHLEGLSSRTEEDVGITRYVEEAQADSQVQKYSDKFRVLASDLLLAMERVTPSALREVAVEVPEVHWDDIGGMESVKQSLREVVEWPLQYPELFTAMKIAPPRGVLLYGPPGCSKTLMAKALATESGMNFLAVRGPELLSKWLGDSEKAVQTLFRRARAAAPSLIFFDEIDAFASKRGDSSAGVNDRVLSQLLTEIDGVQQTSARVVVVAATNRPDMLDAALLRPGRIDRKIYVPPPDRESRLQILCNHLKRIPTEKAEGDREGLSIKQLVDKTEGFSGAEVVSICNEATIFAIDENADVVTQAHLERAIAELKPQITEKMLDFYRDISLRFIS